jgi:hypothetical protein
MVIGFSLAVAGALLLSLVIRGAGLEPKAYALGIRPVSNLIDTPNWFSFMVAVLAGVVGVISITEARSSSLIECSSRSRPFRRHRTSACHWHSPAVARPGAPPSGSSTLQSLPPLRSRDSRCSGPSGGGSPAVPPQDHLVSIPAARTNATLRSPARDCAYLAAAGTLRSRRGRGFAFRRVKGENPEATSLNASSSLLTTASPPCGST